MSNYTKKEPETIESLFNKIAPQYDRANSLMSLNLHKKWNKALAKIIRSHSKPQRLLDLCCGTGEIAFETLQQIKSPIEAFLLDFSQNMLDCAREKAETKRLDQHRLHYLHADAHRVPLPSESIDAATIAYGIRNVKNPAGCIQEVHRVLNKGGIFAILELTQPSNPIMKLGHQLYMKAFLPLIGKFIASDKQAYQYLCHSIQEFLKPIELASLLEKQGFHQIAIKPLNGGIATIVMGRKILE
jgi:demethylmenaquinone methyltransferase / 2-methoxy-6-polyprenyl-1,4-benzoquinol methylase